MIYLIEQDNFYKIGYTSNLERRLKEYSTHNINFKLIDIIEGDKSFEDLLHKKFKHLKYNNEWFHKNDEILEYFKNTKGIKEIPKDFVYMFPAVLDKLGELTEASFKTLQYIVLNAGFAGDPPIGNIFNFNAVVAENMSNKMGITIYAIKKALKKLVELELLIKDKKVRGVYYVNPLYFWKGKLSDRINSIDVSYKYVLKEE